MMMMRKLASLVVALVSVAAMLLPTSAAAAPTDPGKPLPLTPGTDELNVRGSSLSADGRYVVFTGFQGSSTSRLFSVPARGGAIVELTTDEQLVGGGIDTFQIASDSQRVVFAGRPTASAKAVELFSVPIAGGPVTRLTFGTNFGVSVWRYGVLTDASRVIYIARDLDLKQTLHSVQTAGGGGVRLTPAGVTTPGVLDVTSDNRVIYAPTGGGSLFGVPAAGGTPTKLTPASHVLGYSVTFTSGVLAAGQRVVYVADHNGDGIRDLFSVAGTGGTPVQLNRPLSSDEQISGIYVTPDNRRVLYRVGTPTRDLLYTVGPSGASHSEIRFPQGALSKLVLSPDSATVALIVAAGLVPGTLHAAPTSGGDALRLDTYDGPGGVENVVFSPNSRKLVFTAGRSGSQTELYSVSPTGRLLRLLDQTEERLLLNLHVSPDGRHVLYERYDGGTGRHEVYSVLMISSTPVRLSPPNTDYRIVDVTADSSRVIMYERPFGGALRLFTVRRGWMCQGRWATIVGTNRTERIAGTPGNDVIVGRSGNDIIKGRGGNDRICGNRGNDTLEGGRGRDFLNGGIGTDTCNGGRAPDVTVQCEAGSP